MPIITDKHIILNGKSFIIDLENISLNGGNGEVYFAKLEGNEEEYAIKILKEKNNKKNAEKNFRFKREIDFCKEDNHPNIIKVIDCGEYKHHLYYVMKKYPFILTSRCIKKQDPIEIIEQIIQLCNAIKYIHEKGIIHRDLKPDNILVDTFSNIILTDFGIAHFVDSTTTPANAILANRGYAAPEQKIKGNAQNITKACDIYSLGLIINELFTGRKPEGANYANIVDSYPYLSWLDTLVERCINQNAEERPSISEILMEVQLSLEELREKVDCLEEDLFLSNEHRTTKTRARKIARIASLDILSAKYISETRNWAKLQNINIDYHNAIVYKMSNVLKNVLFQKEVLKICEHKFLYEAHSYTKNNPYKPLDLENKEEEQIYLSCKNIIDKYPLPPRYSCIEGRILKTFASCCNYHCEELLDSIERCSNKIAMMSSMPIFELIYRLRASIDKDELAIMEIEDHISLDWEKSGSRINYNDKIFYEMGKEERIILKKFAKAWDVSYCKKGDYHYIIKFTTRQEYDRFKIYSLETTKNDYVFSGDVIDLLRINREYGGIVEIMPITSFDITETIAKLIDNKNAYK